MTEQEYSVAKQPNRVRYCKIELLNHKFQKVDQLDGTIISDSWNMDASSDIRRTGSLYLTPDDDTAYKIQSGSKIWMDKYVQAYVGIMDNRTREVAYTNMGIYLINNPTQTFNSTDNTIQLSLVDLMAKITGLRNGSLDGYQHQLKVGQDVREIMIAILQECGFDRYAIEIDPEDYQTIQVEIKVDANGTYFDLLKKINETQYTNYQMYFDIDGVFHFNKIPMGKNEQIMVDDDMWKDTYIGHQVQTIYDNVKNHVIVLGKTHDIANYCSTVTVSGSTYLGTCSNVASERNNIKLGFTTPSRIENPSFNLNSYGAYIIKDEHGIQPTLEADTYYVIKFVKDETTPANSYWSFMGELTPRGVAKDENVDSPFYVNGTIGDIKVVLSGSDYDNINTSALAQERAEWELYNKCRMNDSITITSVPLYWLDVNWVISITLPTERTAQLYIIKQISTSGSVEGVQSISAIRYYPFYNN